MCSITIRGLPPTMPCTSNRNAPWVPASNVPMPGTSIVRSSGSRSTTWRISSISRPSPSATTRIIPPQMLSEDLGDQHRRHLVERLPEADQEPHGVRRVVRLVVEDLLGADLVDLPGDPAEHERQQSRAPTRGRSRTRTPTSLPPRRRRRSAPAAPAARTADGAGRTPPASRRWRRRARQRSMSASASCGRKSPDEQ